MLREKAQVAAAKELVGILGRSLQGSVGEEGEVHAQHLQVVALLQLGCLCSRLGTLTTSLLTDSSLKLLDTVFSGLLHPKLAVRLAAAACLRQVSSTTTSSTSNISPPHLTPRCVWRCPVCSPPSR